jgi:hypothetical protein
MCACIILRGDWAWGTTMRNRTRGVLIALLCLGMASCTGGKQPPIVTKAPPQKPPHGGGPEPGRGPAPTPPPGSACGQGTYPPLSPGQTTYVITAGDANLTIPILCIPQGVTLKVDPSVTNIVWSVGQLIFEQNATIDLSNSTLKGGRGGDGAPPPGQASYCKQGGAGAAGGGGQTGPSGVSLTIQDLKSIRDNGSLWIRTDGGIGGDGGTGGQGQQGGGHDKRGILGHCGAGNGGAGGPGGPGGQGGSTSAVTFLMHDPSDIPPNNFIAGCNSACSASTRPTGATGNTGVVAVFGSPGCGGNGGGGGPGGLEGDRGESSAGGSGSHGGTGSLGTCTPVNAWQRTLTMQMLRLRHRR